MGDSHSEWGREEAGEEREREKERERERLIQSIRWL